MRQSIADALNVDLNLSKRPLPKNLGLRVAKKENSDSINL